MPRPPGILSITGNYTQTSAGSLTVYLSSTTAGSGYGQLAVSNTASLAGNLDLDLFAGYIPSNGDTYQVVSCGSESGQFASPTLSGFPAGTMKSPTYNSSSVVLTANVPQAVNFQTVTGDLTTYLGMIQGSLDTQLGEAISIPIIGTGLTSALSNDDSLSLSTFIAPFLNVLDMIKGIAANSPLLGPTVQSMVYNALGQYEAGHANLGALKLAQINQNQSSDAANYVHVSRPVTTRITRLRCRCCWRRTTSRASSSTWAWAAS